MYRKLIKREWFRTLADDRRADEIACEPYTRIKEYEILGGAIRGILFSGTPFPGWAMCAFIYGVANFKENPTERIEGCFWYDDARSGNMSILRANHTWFEYAIEHLHGPEVQEHIGWSADGFTTSTERFDIENDRKVYYVFGDDRFEVTIPEKLIWCDREHFFMFIRNQYRASKIPRICVKAVKDCEVYCQQWSVEKGDLE